MTPTRDPPRPGGDWRLRLVVYGYIVAWHLLAPLFFVYLWRRGKREPLYRRFWSERLGLGRRGPAEARPVWVHAASIGELKGAAPVIEALLGHGFGVVVTTWTPAGRQAAEQLFAAALGAGRLQVRYVPAEWPWAVSNFIRRWKPVCAMATESEVWPVLLRTIRSHGLPLCKANAQYPRTSHERDVRWGGLRARLYAHYELVMCKSEAHARRFAAAGCGRVVVVGETRFEQAIPSGLLHQAALLRRTASWAGRPVVCIASAVEREEPIFLAAMQALKGRLPNPLFVYVPRSPQRFEAVAALLGRAGLRVLRRSLEFDQDLEPRGTLEWEATDVLLGDSLGEMFFYLELADVVVVGASFVDQGGHNVIEPLALRKPVWVGPSTWGIEYPGEEALRFGAMQQAANGEDLVTQLSGLLSDPVAYAERARRAQAFFAEHAGSASRHMAAFLPWMRERTRE